MLSIIVPTLGNRLLELERLLSSLDKQINKRFEVICAVQGNYYEVKSLLDRYDFPVKSINLNKRGLSYARNEALKLIGKEVTFVTFSDDDCWYPPHTVENVEKLGKGFEGCLCFQIFDPTINEYYKSYAPKPDTNVSLRKSLKISSIEIFISRCVVNDGLRFNELFGLGTKYPSGEENIFLFDIIRSGYIIKYFPQVIVFHLKPNWKNKEYLFKGKGALFTQLYGKVKALFMVSIYAIMKSRYSDNLLSDVKNMIREVRNFKK